MTRPPAPGATPHPTSDAAVSAKTGRTWAQWLETMDAAGCATMNHREIVAVLRDRYGVGPWWQQMVTVGYERARGLRAVHQAADGFQVSATKTIDAGLARSWDAWTDAAMRSRWLAHTFEVRKATEGKSLRISWGDGTDVQVLFSTRANGKSHVAVDHRKLQEDRVDEMKAFWRERLDALKGVVEGGA